MNVYECMCVYVGTGEKSSQLALQHLSFNAAVVVVVVVLLLVVALGVCYVTRL